MMSSEVSNHFDRSSDGAKFEIRTQKALFERFCSFLIKKIQKLGSGPLWLVGQERSPVFFIIFMRP